MSSTNRGAKRNEHDLYETPAWCVHRLLEACPLPGGRWLEPAAGNGAIIKAVSAVRRDIDWWSNEPNQKGPALHQASYHLREDFLKWKVRPHWPIGCVITNPPYMLALDFVQHAISLNPRHVVMLLRLNFLAGAQRAAWLREHMPDVYVLPNRPSFTGGATDSCEYAWMVWRRDAVPGSNRTMILADTPKDERLLP